MIAFIVTFFSFIFDYFFNYFLNDTIFRPLFVLTSLIFLEPYLIKNKNKYYIYCGVVGFLYDYLYASNYFTNMSLFLIIGLLVFYIDNVMPNNFFVSILEEVILIIVYECLLFLVFLISGNVLFDFCFLFKVIYSSLIINVLYGMVLYFVLYLLSRKFSLIRID